jgi:hypothetical protein
LKFLEAPTSRIKSFAGDDMAITNLAVLTCPAKYTYEAGALDVSFTFHCFRFY